MLLKFLYVVNALGRKGIGFTMGTREEIS